MSTTYISAELRRQVITHAEGLCEYCLIHEDDTFFGFNGGERLLEREALRLAGRFPTAEAQRRIHGAT